MECVVLVSVHAPVDNQAWLDDLAQELLTARLAAGLNISSPVRALFWWQGELTSADEVLLEVTTRQGLAVEVEALILARHPYELPGIRTVDAQVNDGYHEWVIASTTDSRSVSDFGSADARSGSQNG